MLYTQTNRMQNKHIIHIRIRDLRRERELTQEELAEALGISRQSINAMEAGRCLPSLPVALQIASYFAVPLAQLVQIIEEENERRRLLAAGDMFGDLLPAETIQSEAVPAVNMSQTETNIQLSFALPGFKKDDLSIDVGDNFVTVAGEAKATQEQGEIHREFITSSFSRTVSLPVQVQPDTAEAEMRHGILQITLQKAVEAPPRTKRLEIKAD